MHSKFKRLLALVATVGVFSINGTEALAAAQSKSIELPKSEESCNKITEGFNQDKEIIANLLRVSIADVRIVSREWRRHWSGYQCILTVDTPKGPFYCPVYKIYSGNQGRTVIGVINVLGGISLDFCRL